MKSGVSAVRGLRQQFGSALLVICTVAAIFAAGVNFQQHKKFLLPQDGVEWAQRGDQVVALYVSPGGPGERAGVRGGDQLLKISGQPIKSTLDIPRVIFQVGAFSEAKYQVVSRGVEVTHPLVLGEDDLDPALSYQYVVGIVYLLLGLFVYFRRSAAPKALHFYLLCLASFVQYTFHYTGKLNNFDKVIYWGNAAACLLAPCVFLHFCLSFPRSYRWLKDRQWLIYIPGSALLAIQWLVANGNLRVDIPINELRWLLDRITMVYWAALYLGGAGVLWFRYRREFEPVLQRQMAWLAYGVLVGVLPFTFLYAVPYALGVMPSGMMKLAVLTLPLMPLTWAYAIVRHRLMEVDVVFQQGYIYTLAAIAVIGVLYGLFFSIGRFADLGPGEVVALILVATFVFQPIRNFMQEILDRNFFYRGQYDHRLNLIQFARELGGNTELLPMLRSVAERLMETMGVREVAFFVWDDMVDGYELTLGLRQDEEAKHFDVWHDDLDLAFLAPQADKPYLFFESTRSFLDLTPKESHSTARRTIEKLDLTYYLPCIARGKTVAYMGVSRTMKNDFLPSEDVELLMTLTGYIGMAIENSRLYQSLQRKAEEFERLKEFNENIVESINVGILAIDLNGRVESWNSVMERMTGIRRSDALGRWFGQLLPASVRDEVAASLQDEGIYHAYKLDWERDSSERTVNLAVAPLVTRDQARIGRLLIIDDVTDRSELESRLMQADKLSSIGLLAAGVAHEVNTPLAVISSYAQMLAKQVSGDAQKAQLLEKITKQTFRASEIVNSLLNFSRTAPTQFIELDANRVVRETVNLIEPQLVKNGVQMQLDLAEAIGPVRGNPNKLQQVLLNLILNARDAMPAGGTLCVRTLAHDETAEIQVRDSGHGIDPDHLQRVFDPFFTTKGFGKGTGLGLAVTYGIVQEHAGTIEVESEMGQGTTFTLQFPLARKSVAAPTPLPSFTD